MRTIHALGVMTGTSCDGADLALLRLTRERSGHWKEELAQTASAPFPRALRNRLRRAQSGGLSVRESALLNRDYSEWLGRLCIRKISSWPIPKESVLIAVHGQTIWHDPKNHVSVQLLDPAVIANRSRCTVTAAFRQPDLAMGGEGAPLVPFYHWLRSLTAFSDVLPFAIHNVGGIANLTYVTRNPHKVVAFDTGPGNALIDLAIEKLTDGKKHFDRDGKLALSSLDKIDWARIEKVARHPFFNKPPPKSTGRELFNEAFLARIPGRGPSLVANACAFTAHTMAKAYRDFIFKDGRKLRGVFVSGGGAKNPALLRLFSRELARLCRREITVAPLPDEFAPSQYLEAMAFARLGFEALQGKPVSLAALTGASEDAIGAGIFPSRNYSALLQRLGVL